MPIIGTVKNIVKLKSANFSLFVMIRYKNAIKRTVPNTVGDVNVLSLIMVVAGENK